MSGLPDIVRPGLTVIFVGTSVGKLSADRRHYYSDPTNCFYRELYAAGFTDQLLRPDDDHRLPCHGIGLTDLAKRAVSSDDRTLTESDWDRGRLEETIRTYRPRAVCFNGKRAFTAWSQLRCSHWGLQPSPSFDGVPVFVVPSTSGRVPSRARFGGRTRAEWFAELRAWLTTNPGGTADSRGNGGRCEMRRSTHDDQAHIITAEIVTRFAAEKKARYLDGDGYLRYGGRSGVNLIVYRRHNNPKAWTIPLSALRDAVSQSCAVGRPLRAGECNAICNRRGTPLSILLRLVPADCFRVPGQRS